MSKLVLIHTDDCGNRTTVERELVDHTWMAFLDPYEDFLRACGFVIPWESLELNYNSATWNPCSPIEEKADEAVETNE